MVGFFESFVRRGEKKGEREKEKKRRGFEVELWAVSV